MKERGGGVEIPRRRLAMFRLTFAGGEMQERNETTVEKVGSAAKIRIIVIITVIIIVIIIGSPEIVGGDVDKAEESLQ